MRTKKTDCFSCHYRANCLAGLKDEEIAIVDKNKIQLTFKKGELICKRGSPVTHVLFLLDGFIKWHIDGPSLKKNVIFKVEKSGSYVGIPSQQGDKLYHFSTSAVEDSVVCLVEIDLFFKNFRKNPDFSTSILEFLLKGANELFDGIYSYSTKNVNGRVAELLLYLSHSIYNSNSFTLTLSRQELSEFVSISKDNLIHTLSKFNKEGIIKAKGKSIEIINAEFLEKISQVG